MPRALWSGSLSFGLVNVPVVMVTAVRDVDLHFRQLHEQDGAPIEVQRWCSKEDVEVGWDEIARAFELDDGDQVIVTDEELEAIEPRRTRTIEIESFVDLVEVDPIYYDHPYYLLPAGSDDGSARAYRLLVDVMARSDRAAVGRFVMRAKEYLAIVRSRDGALMLSTMLFADEVRDTKDVENAAQKSHQPSAQQLKAAVAVIEELAGDWDPGAWKDRYRRRLRDVVARKRKGQTIKAPEPREAEAPEAPDLMAALERTLADMRQKPKKRQKQEA
ncbi:MAG TPA: Ku protein [Solirubrobacteraceae bacterium]|nr:Ku protein [Solirubrobacteraceae bacterium]